MENPFKYGDPVEGSFRLERKALKKTLIEFLKNRIHTVLIGPRRFGKTSFILDLLQTLNSEKFQTIYIDVLNVTSHRDFLQQLLIGIESHKSTSRKFLDPLKSHIKHIKPEISLDPLPKFSLLISENPITETDVKALILKTLDSLQTLGKNVCIALDEFQAIGELEDKGWLEATLRTKMQHTKNISFIFSGSRHAIIHDMFNNKNKPFYRSCQLIDFPPLDIEFSDWILKKLEKAGFSSNLDTIHYLRKIVDDSPHYVQMACFHLVASNHKHITKTTIDTILKNITSQNNYPYQMLLNMLSPTQKRVLRMAAKEKEGLFSKANLEKYEIKSPAHISQAINSLIEKQLIEQGLKKGAITFDDPLFAIWLESLPI